MLEENYSGMQNRKRKPITTNFIGLIMEMHLWKNQQMILQFLLKMNAI